jgi:transcriptional regulator with XRE-family HTH domain
MPTFGSELRRLRHDAGVSLSELARRVHYSKSHLSKVENGRARPNNALATLCDREFGTGGALAALMPRQPVGRRRNVLLEIRSRFPATVRLPTHPATGDLKLAMLLDIPEVATKCAAPDVGDAITTLCGALRLHGLCGDHCIFVELLPDHTAPFDDERC